MLMAMPPGAATTNMTEREISTTMSMEVPPACTHGVSFFPPSTGEKRKKTTSAGPAGGRKKKKRKARGARVPMNVCMRCKKKKEKKKQRESECMT